MGYLIKAGLGLALFIGGVVIFNVKLVALLETGTCASGNTPYQISKPCPSGTGTDILLLMAGIFGGLIGAVLFANRGESPWGKQRLENDKDFTFPFFAWGLCFTATGATALIASLTDDAVKASQGGQLGGLIVGGVFLLMGVPALLMSLRYIWHALRSWNELPATVTASGASTGAGVARVGSGFGGFRQTGSSIPWMSAGGSGAGGGGTGAQIAKLERLQKLRESGALTDAEFEREKAKILSET